MDNARVREAIDRSLFSLRFYLLNLDIMTLPCVEAEARLDLPLIPAVYFVFLNRKPLYIGQAINLRARWHSHHQLENALAAKAKIAWFEVEPVNLTLIESVLIQVHGPIWNTSRKYSDDDFILSTNSKRFEGMWR